MTSEPTLFGNPVHVAGVRHRAASKLEGLFVWFVPLCWEAEVRSRGGDYDPEVWWVSVDHGAIDPTVLVCATSDAAVTCPDCIEWMRA